MKAETASHVAASTAPPHAAARGPSSAPANGDAFALLLDDLIAAEETAASTTLTGDEATDGNSAAPGRRGSTDGPGSAETAANAEAPLLAALLGLGNPAPIADGDTSAAATVTEDTAKQTPGDSAAGRIGAPSTHATLTSAWSAQPVSSESPSEAVAPAAGDASPGLKQLTDDRATIQVDEPSPQERTTPGTTAALAARGKGRQLGTGRTGNDSAQALAHALVAAVADPAPAARPLHAAAAGASTPGTDRLEPGLTLATAAANPAGTREHAGAGSADHGAASDGRSAAAAGAHNPGPDAALAGDGTPGAADFGLHLGEALQGAFENIGTQVSLWAAGRTQRASFELRDGLDAPLTVDLQLSDGVAQLQFRTDDAVLRQLIQAQAPTALADALARAGVALGQVDVGARGQGGGPSADGSDERAGSRARIALTSPTSAAPSGARALAPRAGTSLDVYA
ncbi:flagellar hook-length control protein FliK [Tepidimonas charontis]|uniref:Flagellar hook-length control protein FliK n=1 Tax=Tepidimonas charontis TaxID=2267262 RepID=A0A554XK71_9BURK|nr:flagellar hook-length control protein FliK [Tepidimonas charontis]TSE36222.1 Flagellar hook-length control protein FliK [Tepidimonas charontis]